MGILNYTFKPEELVVSTLCTMMYTILGSVFHSITGGIFIGIIMTIYSVYYFAYSPLS